MVLSPRCPAHVSLLLVALCTSFLALAVPARAQEEEWTPAAFEIGPVAPQTGWIGETIAPEAWKPVAQPDLEKALKAAPKLKLVDVAPSPQRCWLGPLPYMVPNPDGKSWDMIYPYYNTYGGRQELIIHDFGTGKTTTQRISGRDSKLLPGDKLGFHMQPAFYTAGKLVFEMAGTLIFLVYDPAQDKITQGVKPFGNGYMTGRAVLGDDGVIYGMGWTRKKDAFIAYSYDAATGKAWRSEPFGPANPHRSELYRQVRKSGDWIYAGIGHRPWHLVAYNVKTNEGKLLATTGPEQRGGAIVLSNVPGGIQGSIENPVSIEGIDPAGAKKFAFWLRDGKVYARKGNIPPWSEKPPARGVRTRFEWARQFQVWPAGFTPPSPPPLIEPDSGDPNADGHVTLKYRHSWENVEPIAKALLAGKKVEGTPVAVTLANATLAGGGWNRIDDKDALGGAAIQAQGPQGTATVSVTFRAPGNYVMYYRARAVDVDKNASLGNNDSLLFSAAARKGGVFDTKTARAANAVRNMDYGWRQAPSKTMTYKVGGGDVGKPLTFNVASLDPGVTVDAVLFSTDTGLIGSGNSTLEYDVTMYPGIVKLLTEVNDHVLFATDEGYGQHVFYDLNTKQLLRVGGTLSPYVLGFQNNHLYVCGYPSARLYEYDFTREIGLEQKEPNPRQAALIGTGKAAEFHVPLDRLVAGADGRVYAAGTTVGRSRVGGGFGWYDPKTGETGGMPIDGHRFFWACGADNGRYVLASSKHDKGSLLFCWDTQAQKFIYQKPILEDGRPGPVVEALPGGLVMGHHDKGHLYGLKAATGEVLWSKDVPAKPITSFAEIRRHRQSFRRGPDGFIWTFFDNTLVRIDPRNAKVEPVGELPDTGQLAFAAGNVYIARGSALRRIEGVTTHAK